MICWKIERENKLEELEFYTDKVRIDKSDTEQSEWECYLFGNTPKKDNGFRWRPCKGCEPNWFWRKMQWLILGNKWIKEKK